MNHLVVSDWLMVLAALGYASASFGFFFGLSRSQGSAKAASAARVLIAVAVAIHALYIVHYALSRHVCPVRTINLAVSTGALLATFIYVAVRKIYKIKGFGSIVAPVALGFLLAGRFITSHQLPPELASRALPIHIASNSLGVVLFLLSSAAAALYLAQEHLLKTKQLMSLRRFPSLRSLDSASRGFLLFGYPFMTIGMVTGTLWISKLSTSLPAEYLRVVAGYLSWAIFSFVLILRIRGWQGRRAAFGTLAGFAFASLVVSLYLADIGGR